MARELTEDWPWAGPLPWEARRGCFVGAAVIGGSVISAGAGLASSSISASAAKSAANTQANAANNATAEQKAQFDQTEANLEPFVSAGTSSLGILQNLTGTNPGGNPLTAPLTAPFNPGDLASTPGYKFTLGQGLEAVQNSFAAQGLGSSGAAVKGSASFAENLAQTTYNQQLQNYLSQNQQIYNMIQTQAGSGQNAAAGLGALGQQNVNAVTSLQTGAAAAQAGGTIGAANAVAAGLGGLGNTASNVGLLYALGNGGLYGGANQITSSSNPLSLTNNTPNATTLGTPD